MRHYLLTTFAASVVLVVAGTAAVADDVAELVSAAASQDKEVALPAIDALGKAKQTAATAVPALIKALSSDDTEIRWHAARSLGSLGPSAAGASATLLKALADDKQATVRAYAAYALGKIGDKSDAVVLPLIDSVLDTDPLVRRTALRSLRMIDPPLKKETLDKVLKILEKGDPDIVMPAMATLAEEGESVVPRLCEALDHPEACFWACVVLADIGPQAKAAVPHLKGVLKHDDPEVRLQALITVAEIGAAAKPRSPDIVDVLENDKFDGVRYAAAYALGMIGTDTDAAKALEKASETNDPLLKMTCAWALARNNPEDQEKVRRAVDLIVKAFKSDDVNLRRAAGKAAIDFDVSLERVAPMLVEALQDKNPSIVRNAIEVLAEFGPKAIEHVDDALDDPNLRFLAIALISRLGSRAQPAVPALLRVLKNKPQSEADIAFQRDVLFALAAIGPGASQSIPELVKFLDSDDDETRASAIFALGKMGPAARGTVQRLRANLNNPSAIVRMASIRALLDILPGERSLAPVALRLLAKGLEHEIWLIRAESAAGLGQLGSASRELLPQLKKLLDDENEYVREQAAEAIKKIEG